MKNNTKPWLDSSGEIKSDSELKRVCQNWSSEQWEDYLSTIGGFQTEIILDEPKSIESLSQLKYDTEFQSMISSVEFKDLSSLKKIIREILTQIPENQRKVLDFLFWQDLSVRGTAKRMKISRSAVQQTKDRALKSVAKMIFYVASKSSNSNDTVMQEESNEVRI